MNQIAPAPDFETMSTHANGQDWLVSWHQGGQPPAGRSHGAAGVCVTAPGQLVLISHDGVHWGFPAGRPEGEESLLETLYREMREEACVAVRDARLLGFSRSECVAGHELGLVLVRSYWRADVDVQPWLPEFEVRHRRIVPLAEARDVVRDPDEAGTRIAHRALAEAGIGE
jgi:ADP-ribose pyrophosphatase YjhB (NUDIX family)